MSTFLFNVCAVDRFSSSLFNEYRQLTHAHHKALVARAAAATARLRRRRADRAPVTPSQKRRRLHGFQSLQKLIQRRLDMASNQEIRRRSSAADRNPIAPLMTSLPSATTTTIAPEVSRRSYELSKESIEAALNNTDASAMPPPPAPAAGDASPTRQSRSTSSASRNANRLSLTLPIAPPSSDPSRPTPTYVSANPSVPPTPVDDSATASPSDTNEFIIAIAAQERRVLELREQLSHAEGELLTLKRQWSSKQAYNRKAESRRADTARPVAPTADNESGSSSRHSIDFDRRKLLLQNQNTPTQNRRKVLRGGHTRTLSLLSPSKSDSSFGIHGEIDNEPISLPLPPVERRTAQLTNPNLSKRASWQPQSHRQQASVPGLIEDFRLGLKTFVEDIRQITVGDEPINGLTPVRSPAQPSSSAGMSRTSSGDAETIRPSNAARPKVSTAFDLPSSATSTPTPSSQSREGTPQERARPNRIKHFSWTPLAFDAIDDNAWDSWDSPVSTKSTRWSGSTINSGGAEEIQSIPEAGEEADEPS